MRSLKVAIATACLALAATISPAQATEVQPTASTRGSLATGSSSIEAGFDAYMRCIKGLSHGKVLPPGFCLTEGLITSS
ncbi:hypothetical protein [uncultured Corynebacterium sp.]|uniref:hypothetical protein n=1 Tax=uncultured Corynebacterium sp. TaxID=159447 RepID=UPI0028D8E377|nr:hypothetical protein [uncultured Corynebacterium sp.]